MQQTRAASCPGGVSGAGPNRHQQPGADPHRHEPHDTDHDTQHRQAQRGDRAAQQRDQPDHEGHRGNAPSVTPDDPAVQNRCQGRVVAVQGALYFIELALLILGERHLVFPSRERTFATIRSYPGAEEPGVPRLRAGVAL
jgi:hypothetical protein